MKMGRNLLKKMLKMGDLHGVGEIESEDGKKEYETL